MAQAPMLTNRRQMKERKKEGQWPRYTVAVAKTTGHIAKTTATEQRTTATCRRPRLRSEDDTSLPFRRQMLYIYFIMIPREGKRVHKNKNMSRRRNLNTLKPTRACASGFPSLMLVWGFVELWLWGRSGNSEGWIPGSGTQGRIVGYRMQIGQKSV